MKTTQLTANQEYLKTFFEEKNLKNECFEWIDSNGDHNIMSSEFVQKTLITKTPENELDKITDTIRKLDFKNADINDYLYFLAKQYRETQLEGGE